MYLELLKIPTNANELLKDNASNYYFNDSQLFKSEKTIIGEFKNLNFFVGANNCGKSRFLRGLVKIEKINFHILEKLISFEEIIMGFQINDIISFSDYLSAADENYGIIREFINNYSNKKPNYQDLKINFYNTKKYFDAIKYFEKYINTNVADLLTSQKISKFTNVIINIEQLLEFDIQNSPSKKIYIPTLRSLNRNSLAHDTFEKVIMENYLISDNIFTGLGLYNDISLIKGSPFTERIKVKKFEEFLSKTFFENKTVEITAGVIQPATILLAVDNQEFPIFDIGDGIQMLIILLYPIFTSQSNTWFFIEEPETHLHPGLQRIFIEALINDEYLKSKNLHYFFTTHSNHLLDLSIDSNEIAIFQFQKENQEKFTIKNVKPNKEILDLLGVNNSSVFLANTSIWIEGPTDRKYISKFLKLYCESKELPYLKEDIDFAFFEYGGNLIAHYLFDEEFEINNEQDVRDKINSFALSNKIYLLADNDNATGAKLNRREELEKFSNNKNFKYQNTECKEIENLLPAKVLQDFIPELVKGTEKNKIKISFKREEYMYIGLGKFIVSQFNNSNVLNFNEFNDKSGTLTSNYKNKLCDFVVNGNYTYLDLIENNDILDKIIEGLYSFIKINSIK
jgi:predicted ATPase